MNELYLPESLVASPLAPLLLDKAIKRARAEGLEPDTVVLPFRPGTPKTISSEDGHYRIESEAALNGLSMTFAKPSRPDMPLTAYLNDRPLNLCLPEGLCDWHAHTQFAYCGRGIDLCDATDLAFALGIGMQGFSEHAFALYFPDNALKFLWQGDAPFVERTWSTPRRGRMAAYRSLVASLRGRYGKCVRFGLEVDLFGGGRLCLAPEDTEDWDYLIGAVHEVEGLSPGATQTEVETAWMRDVERLLTYPIAILAHPFRWFPWSQRPVPRHLYRPVARMLAQSGVAAEINHHKNPFEPEFFRLCLEEGAKLSLGTDAHVTRSIADLLPHLRTLGELGLDTPKLRARHLLTP